MRPLRLSKLPFASHGLGTNAHPLSPSRTPRVTQLLYLPDPCTAYQVFPAPVPLFAPPDAPPAPGVRHPYSVWKSAVLGGVLGGVFLVQIIVLAVSLAPLSSPLTPRTSDPKPWLRSSRSHKAVRHGCAVLGGNMN